MMKPGELRISKEAQHRIRMHYGMRFRNENGTGHGPACSACRRMTIIVDIDPATHRQVEWCPTCQPDGPGVGSQ